MLVCQHNNERKQLICMLIASWYSIWCHQALKHKLLDGSRSWLWGQRVHECRLPFHLLTTPKFLIVLRTQNVRCRCCSIVSGRPRFSITSLQPQVQNVDARRHSDLQQRVLKDQQLNPQKACLKEKYACWGGSIMGKCLYSLISHAVTGRTLGCHGESCWNMGP